MPQGAKSSGYTITHIYLHLAKPSCSMPRSIEGGRVEADAGCDARCRQRGMASERSVGTVVLAAKAVESTASRCRYMKMTLKMTLMARRMRRTRPARTTNAETRIFMAQCHDQSHPQLLDSPSRWSRYASSCKWQMRFFSRGPLLPCLRCGEQAAVFCHQQQGKVDLARQSSIDVSQASRSVEG